MAAASETLEAQAGDEADAVMAELGRALAERRRRAEPDPFANPIELLALGIKRQIDDGSLSLDMVGRLIARLTTRSFVARSERLHRYLGETGREANRERLRRLIEGLARDPESGALRPFEAFREAVERAPFGVVFTAHPTFALARELQTVLVELALGTDGQGRPLDEPGRRARIALSEAREHRPDAPLDLASEHRHSLAAIANLNAVLREALALVLEVAEEAYPLRWRELDPRLVTIASWVGYDLDGRADISWATTFEKRLRVQALQIERYRAEVLRLRPLAPPTSPAGDLLELLEARLALAIKQAEDEIAVFAAEPEEDPAAWRRRLAALARAMHEGRASRLTEAAPLIELVQRAVRLVDDPALGRGLCVLRAEMKTHGLGLAHTHTRINARQVHNAVRKAIGLDHPPDDPSHRLTYLNAIAALIEEAVPVSVNFGSLLAEKATAKRVFMIIAQMVKYLDASQPVRFLIAECETGFTLLAALYYARLFGVEDRVEISPLFETEVGLEQGARVLAEALGVASFRAYVRRHGRLCLQTGFSDAGRHLGQIAAAHAIERLRLAAARELAAQGMADVELVIFDTHGESIGRGGHPESFADRLAYVDTPHSRAEFARRGIAHKQEVSFQGGDGYLLFATEDAALAVLTRILEHALAPAEETSDPFYLETDYVHEFCTIVQRYNRGLMEDPCYGALLGAFGANMLYRSGSRAMRRQHDSWSGEINLAHPSQLRAIPHNAILQQLGFLANVLGGLGQAVAKDPERFQRLYEESPRFRRLMRMVEHGFKFSDLVVLRAYIDLFDPGGWLLRASRRREGPRAEGLSALADVMERARLHERLARIWRTFTRDYMVLASALREHRRRTRQAGEEPIAVDPQSRDVMHLLHALRLALIQELYLLAIQVPDFSPRHEITRESLIARLIQLDIETALAKLAEIFPVVEAGEEALDFGEPATYQSAENQSYGQEHARLLQPIAQLYGLIRRTGAAVIHNVGALG